MRKFFSEILAEQGFVRGDELGLIFIQSSDPKDQGTFFRGGLGGIKNTVAVDEEGWVWGKQGYHVDLSPFGFRDLAEPLLPLQ